MWLVNKLNATRYEPCSLEFHHLRPIRGESDRNYNDGASEKTSESLYTLVISARKESMYSLTSKSRALIQTNPRNFIELLKSSAAFGHDKSSRSSSNRNRKILVEGDTFQVNDFLLRIAEVRTGNADFRGILLWIKVPYEAPDNIIGSLLLSFIENALLGPHVEPSLQNIINFTLTPDQLPVLKSIPNEDKDTARSAVELIDMFRSL